MKKIFILIAFMAFNGTLLAQNKKQEQEAVSGIYHFRIENRSNLLERLQAAEAERRNLLLQQLDANSVKSLQNYSFFHKEQSR